MRKKSITKGKLRPNSTIDGCRLRLLKGGVEKQLRMKSKGGKQSEKRERERRKAEVEAHLRKEAEEERRRKLAEDEANWRRKED